MELCFWFLLIIMSRVTLCLTPSSSTFYLFYVQLGSIFDPAWMSLGVMFVVVTSIPCEAPRIWHMSRQVFSPKVRQSSFLLCDPACPPPWPVCEALAVLQEFLSNWSCGVVVITSALHAEGPQFDPGRDQIFFSPPFLVTDCKYHKWYWIVFTPSQVWYFA